MKNFKYYFILFAKKTKNFAKQKIKSNIKFCEKYEIRYTTCNKIITSFSIIQKNKKDLIYKKETLCKKRKKITNKIIAITIHQQYANTTKIRRQQIYNKLLQKNVLEERTIAKEIQKTNYKLFS